MSFLSTDAIKLLDYSFDFHSFNRFPELWAILFTLKCIELGINLHFRDNNVSFQKIKEKA